jgi:hypothetical protein
LCTTCALGEHNMNDFSVSPPHPNAIALLSITLQVVLLLVCTRVPPQWQRHACRQDQSQGRSGLADTKQPNTTEVDQGISELCLCCTIVREMTSSGIAVRFKMKNLCGVRWLSRFRVQVRDAELPLPTSKRSGSPMCHTACPPACACLGGCEPRQKRRDRRIDQTPAA